MISCIFFVLLPSGLRCLGCSHEQCHLDNWPSDLYNPFGEWRFGLVLIKYFLCHSF
jgi:hypothetical protein